MIRSTGMSDQPHDAKPSRYYFASDCRHYRGDKPCHVGKLCGQCDSYEAFSQRICIIKLGALGDVIRTLCILPALRERYPQAHITWVSKPNGCRMIQAHEAIDRVLEFDALNVMQLQQEQFDLVINLDKEPQPCALAMSLTAGSRLGIGLSAEGKPVPFNREAEHYFALGLNDRLKFEKNRKSYQQLVYEALGWEYCGQRYELPVTEQAAKQAKDWLNHQRGFDAERRTLGINVGAGRVFANKIWPVERTVDIISELLDRETDIQILLLGGPDERETIEEILFSLSRHPLREQVIHGGCEHDEPTFVAVVDQCDMLLTGDTMAMHVAIARHKPVVAFFGPTCEQEIDLYSQGEKLIAKVDCGPCYRRQCHQHDQCVWQISTNDIVEATLHWLTSEMQQPRLNSQPHIKVYPLPQVPERLAG